MTERITVDIISDVVCPWCVIGFKRLEQALTDMDLIDQTDIEWHPFEINPHLPPEGEELRAHLSRKYDSSPEDALRSLARMSDLGEELGFTFNFFEGMKMVNTQDAHILLDYARAQGKQTELNMQLFGAFFSECKDISDQHVLAEVVQRVGLNRADALTQLTNTSAREQVQAKEAFWQNQGVTGVPTMIFNQSQALSGAQSVEVYKKVLAGANDDSN